MAVSIVEVFSLRLLILNSIPTRYETARIFDQVLHATFCEVSVALRLYVDSNDLYTTFDEAVKIYQTPHELRSMILTTCHNGADPQQIVKKHYSVPTADKVVHTTPESPREKLLRSLIRISNQNGGSILRECPLFVEVQMGSNDSGTEVEGMDNRVLKGTITVNRDRVQ